MSNTERLVSLLHLQYVAVVVAVAAVVVEDKFDSIVDLRVRWEYFEGFAQDDRMMKRRMSVGTESAVVARMLDLQSEAHVYEFAVLEMSLHSAVASLVSDASVASVAFVVSVDLECNTDTSWMKGKCLFAMRVVIS